jgi:hypothetical protein
VLATVEVVLGLGKSDPPDDMGVVGGVTAVVVPALSDSNALLTVLPVILVRASPDVVSAVLELLVTQPHLGSVGAVFDDAAG